MAPMLRGVRGCADGQSAVGTELFGSDFLAGWRGNGLEHESLRSEPSGVMVLVTPRRFLPASWGCL